MNIKKSVKTLIDRLPYIRRLHKETELFKTNACYPPGHFHSPIVSIEDVQRREKEIWKTNQEESIKGIELNVNEQLDLMNSLSVFYAEMPFAALKNKSLRYYFENDFYSYTDGIILYSMIRYFKPKRIIEIGSGFSSAILMDTNELFFNKNIELLFIEPHLERLHSIMSEIDRKDYKINQSNVQLVPLDVFRSLEENDILFIDSSHIVKTDSDVNFILFEILPILKKGVLIHFHDVFHPFEYPRHWVLQGFNWNEDYFLRAFLMYNHDFKIKLFSNHLHKYHSHSFVKMPLSYKNFGGNLWIQRQ
ncbi:MAG TPA: class I SAM-dependent methyltransferase [Chitinophagaceae bacterium]|nr:class I SAM-dependent methyltransferase [Chitinophagaceae bacterium]